MENKYYTPSLEDFHIGLEYETYNMSVGYVITDFSEGSYNYSQSATPTESMRFKEKFRLPIMPLDAWSDLKEVNKRIRGNRIRVKYLDESDLIELGWEFDETNGGYQTNDNNILILRCFVEGRGWYLTYDENESQFGFGGYVKNKSEMKKLMEMLNIKSPIQKTDISN